MSHVGVSIKKSIVLSVVFLFAFQLTVSTLPSAFAHGGMQPPAADFGGKKASLFVKVDPPVITDITQPISISARFFDEGPP